MSSNSFFAKIREILPRISERAKVAKFVFYFQKISRRDY